MSKMTSVSVVISLAAYQGWKIWKLDIKNAFLYGKIDKNIMIQQPGYVSKEHPGHVCKLKKALYGLKQMPRSWYLKIAENLQFYRYLAINSDSSLFIKKSRGGLQVLVLLYVDDMVSTENSKEEVLRLRAELAIRLQMKDLGELHHFLGLEVERRKNKVLISQKGYTERIVKRFSMWEGKISSIPLEVGLKLQKDEGRVLPDPLVF